ncbi:MAG: iron ABC transporter substrate-binding protein [Dehalococcoidia bacterium]
MKSVVTRVRWRVTPFFLIGLVVMASLTAACGGGEDETLVVYSGRTDSLVRPILDQFAADTGIDIEVRYDSSAGVATLLLEEGENTRADVVLLQDAGALGALAKEGMLQELTDDLLERVEPRFRSPEGLWVGTSGRARTIVYNTQLVDPETDLPDSVFGFTEPDWRGRVGWAPFNASFQAFVTAMRVSHGEDVARQWLEDMRDNDTRVYPNNITIVDAASRAEIFAGLVNHYYLYQFLEERGEDFGARNHYLGDGDIGSLINVAGVGIVAGNGDQEAAERFVEYLLSETAQQYFSEETSEYPLVEGVEALDFLPPLSSLDSPDIDLSDLDDLEGTLDLLREVGLL